MTSVIIPVFDGSAVLPITVPAVTAQVGDIELIWVDDGSEDHTLQILSEMTATSGRTQIVHFPENRGRSAARNAGVAAASGDILVFLDADVEPSPSTVRALAYAASSSGAVASVARLTPVATRPDEPYQDYAVHYPRGPSASHRSDEALDWRYFLAGACAVRRDAFEASGGFPEDVSYGEDLALAQRLGAQSPHGLRLARASVRLHDLGDLDRAVGHAAQFGRDAASSIGSARATGLERSAVLAPLARLAAPLLRGLVRTIPFRPFRRVAVRYLLGSTALCEYRRARDHASAAP